ncbi:hypothetical protein Hanom_Chr14g01318251 [Helianthus anomalus]
MLNCNYAVINCCTLLRALSRQTGAHAPYWFMCAHVLHAHARMRHFGSIPFVSACVRHVTCEPIRVRHTAAPYCLTLVRRARHIRSCATAQAN